MAVPLADFTTLRVGGPGREVREVTDEADLVAVVTELDAAGEPLLLLGGGSNVVIGDAGFAGTVVRIATRGIDFRVAHDQVDLLVHAGEPWDEFVAATVADGLAGLEALSGIPGQTGATPIQNVGAYGQEVAQTISWLRVLDRRTGQVGVLDPDACGFAYRSSAFKRASRYVVLAAAFRLQRSSASLPIAYAELARTLGVSVGGTAPLAAVRDAVLGLRRSKGMVLDPADPDTASAGSFFTNPVLSADQAAALPAAAPRFPQPDGRVKTSAAWLIEAAGFTRGYGTSPIRISSKHTLALTNTGGGTAAELLDLARLIRDGVRHQLGVDLVPEPVFVNCHL